MSEKTDKLWKQDDYLKPLDPNDPMLMFDIEGKVIIVLIGKI